MGVSCGQESWQELLRKTRHRNSYCDHDVESCLVILWLCGSEQRSLCRAGRRPQRGGGRTEGCHSDGCLQRGLPFVIQTTSLEGSLGWAGLESKDSIQEW